MDQLHELFSNPIVFQKLTNFLSVYGMDSLVEAMEHYADSQQDYVCKTKTSITRIKISEIYYLKIHGHQITIHTGTDCYQKYGTLVNEIKLLSHHGFIQCNQSCIVSISKIKHISQNEITLTNGTVLHISRNCAPKVLVAFYSFIKQRSHSEKSI